MCPTPVAPLVPHNYPKTWCVGIFTLPLTKLKHKDKCLSEGYVTSEQEDQVGAPDVVPRLGPPGGFSTEH